MKKARSSPGRRWLAVGACGLVALVWFAWLRPTALGGAASYVVVKGSSMEPTYDDGDLVIVRKESRYDEGDIIAFRVGGRYEDPTRIIHRIVGAQDDGSFVTRGDNRDRIDPWAPLPKDVIGRAVLHVPHMGDLATAAGRPQVLAALGAAAVMVGGQKRRRRRMTPVLPAGGAPAPGMPPRPMRSAGAPPRWLRHTEPRWAFVGLLVTVALAIPVLLTTWSTVQAPDSEVRVQQIGQVDLGIDVDYRFLGDPSPVYPSGVVETSRNAADALAPTEPLYSRLLHRLEVALGFRTSAEGADDLVGTYQVDVALKMPEGWSTTIATVGPKPIDGLANEVVTIDLVDAAARVRQVTELTGVGGDQFTLTVTPRLDVEGSASGQPLRESVAPTAVFDFSQGVITVSPIASTGEHRPLGRDVRESLDYGLGPISLDTQAARGVMGGLALVVLVALGVFASVLFTGVGLGESERIAARYRSQIVDVAAATGPPGPVVMVSAIDELARLAKVEQSVILHEDLGDGGHRYRVYLGAVTYEYETAPEHGGQAVAAPDGSAADSTGT